MVDMQGIKEKLIRITNSDITKKYHIFDRTTSYEVSFVESECGSQDSEDLEVIKFVFKLISPKITYKAELFRSTELISAELQYGNVTHRLLLSPWKK